MALVRAVGGRLVVFGVSLLLASLLIFVLTHALPGDPAIKILGTGADPTAIAELRHRLGLDRPASVQYLDWLGGFVTGDLGRSYTTNEPVAVLIAPRIGVTGWLCGISILLAPLVALPQGMLAAVKRRNWSGFAASALSQLGLAVPAFYAGILLVVVFAVKLHWLPANGYVELRDATGWWDWPGWAQHLVLPVLSLVLVQASVLTRYVRSAFLEVVHEDYFRTARSIGWTQWRALWRHGLRNVAISVVTVLGLQLSTMLVGAIVVEQVFRLPGLGTALLQAVSNGDLQVVQTIVMLLVGFVLVMNLLTDLVYLVIDPRLRSGGRR